MGDFYIRQSAEGETRGPFDEDQLVSLADAGQITLDTEVADESKSQWVAVKDFPEMKAMVFPEQKKLGLKKEGKKEEDIKYINKPEDAAKPAITVEQMLAAAEGHTDDTRHLKDIQKEIGRAAGLSMPVLTAMMVLSGLANSLPRYQVLMDLFQGKLQGIIQEPFALVGLFDFLLALGLFLNIFSLFPVVRFRAMLGLGYFLFFYWSLGDPVSMAAAVAAGLGLFVCTMTLNLKVMVTFALVGVGGMGYLAWMAWTAFSNAAG